VRDYFSKSNGLFALALVASLFLLSGCAGLDPDGTNTSPRPWGGSKDANSGLPSTLTEGR
jgi:hypothetical protein